MSLSHGMVASLIEMLLKELENIMDRDGTGWTEICRVKIMDRGGTGEHPYDGCLIDRDVAAK
jgi:hypothetical protein